MITLKELAEKCGVSIATISNVINGKSNVSEETKERIQKMIRVTGYQPNYMARTLRAQRTRTIGLIIEDICAFSSPKIIEGIMNTSEKNNYRCILENLRFYAKQVQPESSEFVSQVNSAVEQMKAIKVDGIIYVAAHGHLINFLPENIGTPVVIAYGFSEKKSCPSVTINDRKAGYDAGTYLIKHGHEKIAILAGAKGSEHSELRCQGLIEALNENNIAFNSNMIFYGNWNRKYAKEITAEILKAKPTALFAVNDLMAAGVFDYMRENNLVPGKDLAIIGFDGREGHDFMYPKLTSMAIDLYGIGHYAADLIIRQIEDGFIPERGVQVACILDEGQSV